MLNTTLLFLPRDATQARPMLSCGACLSVCLSVTFVNSVKTSNHIFKCFSPSGSPTTLVLPYQRSWQYSGGNPLNGGVECRWGRHKSRFWTNSWLSIDACSLLDVPATATDDLAVYRTDGDASANLVYHSLQLGRIRRREENII